MHLERVFSGGQMMTYRLVKSRESRDFLVGPVVESLSCIAGNSGWIPGQGTMMQRN